MGIRRELPARSHLHRARAVPGDARGRHDRRRAGLNHLAFRAGTRSTLDRLVDLADQHGWQLMFADRHPFAGGPDTYVANLEDDDGYEIELVTD